MLSPSTSPHLEHTRPPTAGSSSRTSSSRCNQCIPGQRVKGRNLVVCIDGTCMESGPNSTNVVKLYNNVDQESTSPKQLALYLEGLGTHPKLRHCSDQTPEQHVPDLSGIGSGEKSGLTALLEKTIALNVEKAVKKAYRWLAENYQEGDQIYLFGFSRGAYQVRVLAGMIHEVGLIKEMITENEIEKAYDYHEAVRQGKPTAMRTAREFKNTVSWQGVRVHFVGVWDTVSSVGFIRKDVFLSISSSAEDACHFRHALALDERRVGFMPEYFCEVNSQTGVVKSKYAAASCEVEQASSASDWYQSTLSDDGSGPSASKKKSPDIKEVWFAGSHSDVGGQSGPGDFRNAGHVSLLWMRREASANGLVLKPTDIVWLPDDLDSGVTNSMTFIWPAAEYLPIKHQVSFSGAGEDARSMHRQRPRRILPGQKVHASILYANTYQPKATLGEGFDIPIIHSGLDDVELKNTIWETGLFDDTAAQELITSLGSQQGVAPIHLDRLLFMLRFQEGKRYVREVTDWQGKFMRVITDRNRVPLVRLVAIVAYHEASCDSDAHPKGCAPSPIELSQDIFRDAKECMKSILGAPKWLFALLRPLTKHQILRERILSPKIVERLLKLFDAIIKKRSTENFGQAMDCLNYLLQCKDIRQFLIDKLGNSLPNSNVSRLCHNLKLHGIQQLFIDKLGVRLPNSNVSRLSHILKVDDSPLLTAALRTMLTLARIPEARAVCSIAMKPRISELARKSPLAIEILFFLDDPDYCDQLNIRDARVQANLTSALVRLYLHRHGSASDQGHSVDPGQQMLRYMFGIGATELTAQHRERLGVLKTAVEKANVRERTSATIALLTLCETVAIRAHLRDDKSNLLGVFVRQLWRKRTALLAAYALATCLKYSDMESIKDHKDLPKRIVNMLRLDYFDDAIGQIEGFQVFRDLMQHADLRDKIKNRKITHVLTKKLGKDKPRQIRMSLICLDILRTCDPDHPWTKEIVDNGLERLKSPKRKTWKTGATILSALAKTQHGVAAVIARIREIVEMLLPENYQSTQPTPPQATAGSSTTPSLAETQTESIDSLSTISRDVSPSMWPAPRMMGPANALRILAQNETLRDHTRETEQYHSVKQLYYGSGRFIEKDDVIKVFGEMFNAVEQ